MRSIFFFLAVFIFCMSKIHAQCMLQKIHLKDRVEAASIIAEGKIVSQVSYWDAEERKILTSNYMEIHKLFKGVSENAILEIITEGGIVGDKMMRVSGSLQLKENDYGVFLLQETRSGIKLPAEKKQGCFEIYAWHQGFFKINISDFSAQGIFENFNDTESELYPLLSKVKPTIKKEISTEKKINGGAKSIPIVSGFSPQTITAGTKTRLTITGSGFGTSRGNSEVLFSNADDGGSTTTFPLPGEYISWSNEQVIVEVPSDAGTGRVRLRVNNLLIQSQQILNVVYSRISVISNNTAYTQYLVENDPTGGYIFQMNNLFNANTPARESFIRAFNNWRCSTGINWFLGEPTNNNAAELDQINVIRFDIGNELPAGVLGITYSYYSSCQPVRWYLSEIDMVFDDLVNWQFGPGVPGLTQSDFETIVLHELGHAHQLGHVIDPADLMNYAYDRGTTNRSLSQNNINAAVSVIETSDLRVCNLPPMLRLPHEICETAELSALEYEGFTLGPNPAYEGITIKYKMAQRGNISMDIFNFNGQIIYSRSSPNLPPGFYEITINNEIADLRPGLYFLRFTQNDKREIRKFVIR
jgi:hypothetical protein